MPGSTGIGRVDVFDIREFEQPLRALIDQPVLVDATYDLDAFLSHVPQHFDC